MSLNTTAIQDIELNLREAFNELKEIPFTDRERYLVTFLLLLKGSIDTMQVRLDSYYQELQPLLGLLSKGEGNVLETLTWIEGHKRKGGLLPELNSYIAILQTIGDIDSEKVVGELIGCDQPTPLECLTYITAMMSLMQAQAQDDSRHLLLQKAIAKLKQGVCQCQP